VRVHGHAAPAPVTQQTAVPSAPTALSNTVSNTSVTLTWTNPSSQGVLYNNVYRGGSLIASPGAPGGPAVTTFIDTAAPVGSDVYIVTAVNQVGEGAQSSSTTASVTQSQIPPSTIALDTFTRTTSSGWGTADTGGAWTVEKGTSSDFSTDGANGIMAIAAATYTTAEHVAILTTTTALEFEATFDITFEDDVKTVASPIVNYGGLLGSLIARYQSISDVDNALYKLSLSWDANSGSPLLALRVQSNGTTPAGGAFRISVFLDGTNGNPKIDPTVDFPSGPPFGPYSCRFRIYGSTPTSFLGRVWKKGTTEPTIWHISGTDSGNYGPQVTGPVGFRMSNDLSNNSGSTFLSLTSHTHVDNLSVGPVPTASGVPNQVTGLTATVSGSSVILNWTNPSSGATVSGDDIYRDGVKIAWPGAGQIPAGSVVTTYTDSSPGTGQHTYQVDAYNGSGEGALSNAVTVTVGSTSGGSTILGNYTETGLSGRLSLASTCLVTLQGCSDYADASSYSSIGGYTPPSNLGGIRLLLALPMNTNSDSCTNIDSHLSTFTTLATTLVSHGCANAIIRPGWEWNGDWGSGAYVGWQRCGYAAYTHAFQQIVTAMRSVAGQAFLFDWCANAGSTPKYGGTFMQYYPGDSYVDFFGADHYASGQTPPAGQTQDQFTTNNWNSQLNATTGNGNLLYMLTQATAHGKKISIPEWGFKNNLDEPAFVDLTSAWCNSNHAGYQSLFNVESPYKSDITILPLSLARYQTDFAGA
jgi:hypothetical protein